jgi:hypothetical protein
MAPDWRVWAASLPREQRRAAGVGDAVMRAEEADEWDRDEAGPDVSGQGVREKERE